MDYCLNLDNELNFCLVLYGMIRMWFKLTTYLFLKLKELNTHHFYPTKFIPCKRHKQSNLLLIDPNVSLKQKNLSNNLFINH